MKGKSRYKNYFDVVIIPPGPANKYAIQLSKKFSEEGKGEFTLGKASFVPHISLFHIAVKPNQMSEFRKILKKIFSESRPGVLGFRKIKEPKEGSVWIEVNRPKWLVNLHQRVVKETLSFRDPDFNIEDAWGSTYKPTQHKLIKKYGSPYIGRYFQPHITLTVLNKGKLRASEIPLIPIKFKVSSLSVYQLGPYHSCKRRVFFIPFKKKESGLIFHKT